ncbi:hypothetical protein [Candidatus Uabimicrobium sp. HlEnr_7]|uniref:hypothetical protein n=1 Tax=Candidatus Uabimicrobium helgolandensis TaxID=3095367 RepID=UPI003558C0D4
MRNNVSNSIIDFLKEKNTIESLSCSVDKSIQQNNRDKSLKVILQYLWVQIQILQIAEPHKSETTQIKIHPYIWNLFVRTALFLKTDFAIVKQKKKIDSCVLVFSFPILIILGVIFRELHQLYLKNATIALYALIFITIQSLLMFGILFIPQYRKKHELIRYFTKVDQNHINIKKLSQFSQDFFPFKSESTWNYYKENSHNLDIYKIKTLYGRSQKSERQTPKVDTGKTILLQEALLSAQSSFYGWGNIPVLIGYCHKLTSQIDEVWSKNGRRLEERKVLGSPDEAWVFYHAGFVKIPLEKHELLTKKYRIGTSYIMVFFKFFIDTSNNLVKRKEVRGSLAGQGVEYQIIINNQEMTIIPGHFSIS